MTRSTQPRRRSSTGAKCEFPGCSDRASSTRTPVAITISGRPITVERLCTPHREQINGNPRRPRPNPTRTRRPAVSVAYYRCGGCDRLHPNYTAAERCADTHGGGRLTAELELETGYSPDHDVEAARLEADRYDPDVDLAP